MKKVYIAVLAMMMSLGLIACSNNTRQKEINESNGKIKVYATIFPVYDFAKNIGKDKIELNCIVPPSSEPHDYEISAKTIKDIQNADLLIKNGLGIDGFADNIKSESDKLDIIIASEGIEKITYEEEGHDEDEIEEEHEHGKYDPHVWLNINNAIKECENIKNAFIKIDSKNKGYYEENYNNYVKELKDLQEEYNINLKDIKNKTILVSHDAYGYLCKQYGINQISITGINPNQEPSMNKIAELTNYVKDNNIKYILFDGLVNPKVSQTIANEAKIDTGILYSIDGITKDDFNDNEDYISLMEKNLETLKIVLK
ncbi:zinc ABC transporter substrate-binding protein [Romboutsia ilealis]|uniref:Zinc ABC transporter substrate-binding protein n=1 Tax=Romboutsia faecis TaxID=2764597 RepID=A0ABR7JMZ8_9FIRM|nr:zinc ABC transporter substrate-binding protein [Romboutsia faecis]MBC5996287.1 zinc ABC transporter substrate-binding protein [Romboutsia faecis]MRN25072.1 zinc ABC transporter substrate-binding protein [Romboutsia ilealis]